MPQLGKTFGPKLHSKGVVNKVTGFVPIRSLCSFINKAIFYGKIELALVKAGRQKGKKIRKILSLPRDMWPWRVLPKVGSLSAGGPRVGTPMEEGCP